VAFNVVSEKRIDGKDAIKCTASAKSRSVLVVK
jgi:hypothetical protein